MYKMRICIISMLFTGLNIVEAIHEMPAPKSKKGAAAYGIGPCANGYCVPAAKSVY